jgi:hypothetical protein
VVPDDLFKGVGDVLGRLEGDDPAALLLGDGGGFDELGEREVPGNREGGKAPEAAAA